MPRYCSQCGGPVTAQAKFCSSCGGPLGGSIGSSPGGQRSTQARSGHWEYEEFTERLAPYAGATTYSAHVMHWHGAIQGVPNSNMREPIKKAVRALLTKASQEGWEPIEPLDPDRLWDAKRISVISANGFLDNWSGESRTVRLNAVNINFRRWSEV